MKNISKDTRKRIILMFVVSASALSMLFARREGLIFVFGFIALSTAICASLMLWIASFLITKKIEAEVVSNLCEEKSITESIVNKVDTIGFGQIAAIGIWTFIALLGIRENLKVFVGQIILTLALYFLTKSATSKKVYTESKTQVDSLLTKNITLIIVVLIFALMIEVFLVLPVVIMNAINGGSKSALLIPLVAMLITFVLSVELEKRYDGPNTNARLPEVWDNLANNDNGQSVVQQQHNQVPGTSVLIASVDPANYNDNALAQLK